ncbi:NOP protein chaperone 1 [Lethenteron reissneri]|uniref:NOP protein chaperone 1 n=1 Tax=Lethenteron reissneri TaxID=7753 RepID=UPI002AB7ACFD|nr:NOP protein chaperone 1 [Lethenteron reissneri]
MASEKQRGGGGDGMKRGGGVGEGMERGGGVGEGMERGGDVGEVLKRGGGEVIERGGGGGMKRDGVGDVGEGMERGGGEVMERGGDVGDGMRRGGGDGDVGDGMRRGGGEVMESGDGEASPGHANTRRGVTVSRELLGVKGGPVIPKQLFINPRLAQRTQAAGTTSRLPPSCALSQVKKFLPQLATANDVLQRQVQEMPAGHFDIEHVDDGQDRVIEMSISLVERGDNSDTDEDEEEEDCSSSGSSSDSETADGGEGLPAMPRLRLSQKPAAQARHRIVELDTRPATDQPPREPQGT